MNQAERRDGAKKLNDRLAVAAADWGSAPIFTEHVDLLWQIVSRVSLTQNGRDIRHISSEIGEESVRVTVFFDDAVVTASFKEGALVVDLYPLIITSMRITSTQDYLSDDARVDPELPLAVNVTLAEGGTLTLRGSGDDDDPLTTYLPHLLKLTAKPA